MYLVTKISSLPSFSFCQLKWVYLSKISFQSLVGFTSYIFLGDQFQGLLISLMLGNWMQGFRKVDPDRWEFANEGFLAGQRHLLKTIKRRRQVSHGMQQGGVGGVGGVGAWVEVGQYGLEGDLERLKRDRSLLMAEIMRLRQQQQNSRVKMVSMEDRLQTTERKQQQIMTFLAKALSNPSFIQQFAQRNAQRTEFQGVEIGRKRRLTTGPSVESSPELVSLEAGSGQVVGYASPDQEELATMESEIETFFSAALDNESSSDIKDPIESLIPSTTNGCNLDFANETIWEELLNDDLIAVDPVEEAMVGDQSEIDVGVDYLFAKPAEWGEDLRGLVDQMGHLRSMP